MWKFKTWFPPQLHCNSETSQGNLYVCLSINYMYMAYIAVLQHNINHTLFLHTYMYTCIWYYVTLYIVMYMHIYNIHIHVHVHVVYTCTLYMAYCIYSYSLSLRHVLFTVCCTRSLFESSRGQDWNLNRSPSIIPCSLCIHQGPLERLSVWYTQWG